ncbi:class C beta-lactamase-related serine hydrolase [Aquimarina sp. AD1]|uniref:serine hydrolase domain-containing protein n=1 Tax=Aquimarina sp. (strain AD1) TaxID=1714848 RepID=UPI000E4BB629|nr:serine hydrolase [Aquimarina sp. AD1]AXT55149.1 class C beta-lactamase-related serine hydrolase [Aquimarina sp. AD1]RKN19633.1 class C beta-lactamase-related serine hydrolase [Aquimarina sp. AD1]
MNIKIKRIILGVCTIILILVIYLLIPQVSNPTPNYETALTYGIPVSEKINNILTPTIKPKRTRAIMVMQNEKVIYEYGPTDKIMNGHSTRKAMLSLLYGIAVDQELINLDKTLAQLEVDEFIPLTTQEKSATIRDLLMGKSGVYLPASGEHDNQITQRPKRESHKPGTYFFNNNFDANVLGTIFMKETGISIGKFMEDNLAKPLGLQDFDSNNVIIGSPWFIPKKKTMHKQYYIYISTRDFARIGAMVANNGKWNGKQIISEDWITKSTSSYSDLTTNHINYGRYDGFGYQWWTASDTNTIWTDGYGERFMIINRNKNLTLVEQNFTGNSLLSSGFWLINKNMDSGLLNLMKAHETITSTNYNNSYNSN